MLQLNTIIEYICYNCYKNRNFEETAIIKENSMAGTVIDNLGWLINLILTVFFDPLVQGINRVLRGRLLIGIIWIFTGGLFGIGWIIDILTMLLNKDITFLA